MPANSGKVTPSENTELDRIRVASPGLEGSPKASESMESWDKRTGVALVTIFDWPSEASISVFVLSISYVSEASVFLRLILILSLVEGVREPSLMGVVGVVIVFDVVRLRLLSGGWADEGKIGAPDNPVALKFKKAEGELVN